MCIDLGMCVLTLAYMHTDFGNVCTKPWQCVCTGLGYVCIDRGNVCVDSCLLKGYLMGKRPTPRTPGLPPRDRGIKGPRAMCVLTLALLCTDLGMYALTLEMCVLPWQCLCTDLGYVAVLALAIFIMKG